MEKSALIEFYQKRKSVFADHLNSINKRINVVSNVRIGIALIFLGVIYFSFSNTDLLYALPVVVTAFVISVRKHAVLFADKTHLQHMVNIQEQELLALEGNFLSFDSGKEFINAEHPYSHDLDIFGEGSLFQYINRISTLSGKKLLASRLSEPLQSLKSISLHQQAVKDLSSKTDFRHHFQATGKEIEEQAQDAAQLNEWLSHRSFVYGNRFLRFILVGFPLLTTALLLASFFVSGIFGYVVICAALQWIILATYLKKVNAFHQYIGGKKSILERYARMLHLLQREKFDSHLLQKLALQAQEADNKVKSLSSLVYALDARMNFMTNLFVNSLFMYDLQCVYRLERWKEEHAQQLPVWLETVTETEVLCTFATYAFNHPAFTYPSINLVKNLHAVEMGHPLIAAEELVPNNIDFSAGQSILVITGANMAGKSTFLRTLGVNVVLALAGAPVCAKSFDCPLIEMRTGMRTADSLKDHQSYFYAELNRLKSIMDELRSGKPLLILLDEILKGTNSTDKQAGSISLVKQLMTQNCLALIATHDLALGDLETTYPGKIRNYCFEANIEHDQLSFDYKLKRGITHKMNATFLMKKMGIIPS